MKTSSPIYIASLYLVLACLFWAGNFIVGKTASIIDIGIKINKSNYETAVKIASVPDQIRGFGHVKEKNIKDAINYRTDLLNSFHENT